MSSLQARFGLHASMRQKKMTKIIELRLKWPHTLMTNLDNINDTCNCGPRPSTHQNWLVLLPLISQHHLRSSLQSRPNQGDSPPKSFCNSLWSLHQVHEPLFLWGLHFSTHLLWLAAPLQMVVRPTSSHSLDNEQNPLKKK